VFLDCLPDPADLVRFPDDVDPLVIFPVLYQKVGDFRSRFQGEALTVSAEGAAIR